MIQLIIAFALYVLYESVSLHFTVDVDLACGFGPDVNKKEKGTLTLTHSKYRGLIECFKNAKNPPSNSVVK